MNFFIGQRGQIITSFNTFGNSGFNIGYSTETITTAVYDKDGNFIGYKTEQVLLEKDSKGNKKVVDTDETSSEEEGKKPDNNEEQTVSDEDLKLMAWILRNIVVLGFNPFTGITPNPFYKAEAISVAAGILFVGAEGDIGFYFILAGENMGEIVPFSEIASGSGTELSGGTEVARIDYSGNAESFSKDYLFGNRQKVWIGAGEIVGGSIGFAWNATDNYTVYSTSLSGGFSFSPWFISGGYNQGIIKP